MKNLKKSLFSILAFSMVTSLFPMTALAEEKNETVTVDSISEQLAKQAESEEFCVTEGDVHITGCVLVKDGKSYVLSQDEYLKYKLDCEEAAIKEDDEDLRNPSNSARSISREFNPSSKTTADYDKLKKRVTAISEAANVDNVAVSSIYTYTRTASTSKGVTLSAEDLKVIDAKVSASYSLNKSSSSSKSTSITGTFKPTGKYKYMAVIFTPRLATVKGTYKVTANIMGSAPIGNYDCTLVYPVTNGKVLDGIYKIYESDKTSEFPELAK